ncbi:ATP-binding cassette domain-containing protein [Nocardia otitidiscaviarum]|uniref:ATP-binding cassette domain-containing protein n=1 Tax=Nocardia otitidiscaviarum TaxID=1823 RepID=A0A516NSM8_9NOCA|nr:ATP-binding cassette domain-containing protein [Nocardia otitidiscaviarum]MCP9621158.1 ATP-binding cassette domain-containing protein [Nocardia otitidiscaviarum]QDP81910.1 ATP-binding cassette domain-containing protein [Nocardia otitidiscaviarum]
MNDAAIVASGLRKAYGDKTILDGIDLNIGAGTIFSLLGPNGAGKTTTVNVLTTLQTADGGTVRIAGHDLVTEPEAVRRVIGVTGQFAAVDDLLTGEENLRLMADLHRMRAARRQQVIDALLERFELTASARKPAATYSGGMRRKLDLAMTLVTKPDIVFLDEPTTGLDPRSRRTMWEIVRELTSDGVTIFLTTQYLEEADQLADRIAVLDAGRIVAEGTAEELKRRIPGSHIRLRFTTVAEVEAAERALPTATRDDDLLALRVEGGGGSAFLRDLLDRLAAYSLEAAEVSIHTPDLDDVFFALTGRATTEAVAS